MRRVCECAFSSLCLCLLITVSLPSLYLPDPSLFPQSLSLLLFFCGSDCVCLGVGALILGHVPPCLDSYGQELQWQEQYVTQYFAIIALHSTSVVAQLYGHVHKGRSTLPFSCSVCYQLQ